MVYLDNGNLYFGKKYTNFYYFKNRFQVNNIIKIEEKDSCFFKEKKVKKQLDLMRVELGK